MITLTKDHEEFLQVAAGEGSADDLLNWVLTHAD